MPLFAKYPAETSYSSRLALLTLGHFAQLTAGLFRQTFRPFGPAAVRPFGSVPSVLLAFSVKELEGFALVERNCVAGF